MVAGQSGGSRGGNIGTTRGRYKATTIKDGKKDVRAGDYFTVWEKDKNDVWKVVFDTGERDPQPNRSNVIEGYAEVYERPAGGRRGDALDLPVACRLSARSPSSSACSACGGSRSFVPTIRRLFLSPGAGSRISAWGS